MRIPRMSPAALVARATAQAVRARDVLYPNGTEYTPTTLKPDSTSPIDNDSEPLKKRTNKHGNTRCEWNGLKFMSLIERDRYIELSAMQDSGLIVNLVHEPRFILIPPVFLEGKNFPASTYKADSSYEVVETGEKIVEDVKGGDVTQLFQWKRKMIKSMFGFEIKLWRKSGETSGNVRKKSKKCPDGE